MSGRMSRNNFIFYAIMYNYTILKKFDLRFDNYKAQLYT